MKRFFVLLGFCLLLVGSYLDNVRGPLLPILATVFHLNYSQTGFTLVLANTGAILGIFGLLVFSQIFSEWSLLLGVLLLSLISILLSLVIEGYSSLLLFSLLLGAAIALLGSMSNLMIIRGTDERWRAPTFCLLHMMYGLGSLAGPWLLTRINQTEATWYRPLLISAPFVGLGLVLVFLSRSKLRQGGSAEKQSLRLQPIQRFICFLMAVYVIGEVMTTMWMTTYLVQKTGDRVEGVTFYLTGFFALLALSRGLLFVRLNPKLQRGLLILSLVLSSSFFIWGLKVSHWGLIAAGILGPFFPLFVGRVTATFPLQSRTLMLWMLGVNQVAQMVGHQAMGILTDRIGIARAYWLPAYFLVGASLLLIVYFFLEPKPE